MRIHLDTDFGGDPDDACALAMLLGWADVDLVGITTTIDRGGRRAAYVAHCLALAGRADIPVQAGSEVSLTTLLPADPYIDERYWPGSLVPRPAPPGAALDLLSQSMSAGATIVGIGPATNLALLEVARSGSLARVPVVMMGGWLQPPEAGLPPWGPELDFNVQWDSRAAEIVAAAATDLTWVTFAQAFKAALRVADLPRLRASGPLGALLARQSEAHAQDNGMASLGRAHAGLPDDLVNIHWDPVTCAVALGWSGAAVAEQRLAAVLEDGVLRLQPHPEGRPMRVVVALDGERFGETWLAAVEAAQA